MLFLYGTTVFGFERGAFLAKWFIGVTGSHVRVAINSEGYIKGYTVARPRLQGKRSFELVYMTTNDLPEACFDINDSEVGGNTKVGNSVKQAPSPGGFSEILGTVPESILLVTVSIHTSARVTVAVCT